MGRVTGTEPASSGPDWQVVWAIGSVNVHAQITTVRNGLSNRSMNEENPLRDNALH
jgi:hypothetical protein